MAPFVLVTGRAGLLSTKALALPSPTAHDQQMCNRYISPDQAAIERAWTIGRSSPNPWQRELLPRRIGPFLRPGQPGEQGLELVSGQWALIPRWADSPNLKYSSNNARSEELAAKPTYREAWSKGQRCIIPVVSFDEPCWETGKNVWWRFGRADGELWGLAGLWNAWTDKATGEVHESYTMLTINADDHPLMSRMHKPDPKLPPDQQDKRSVVAIEKADVEQWFQGSIKDAQELIKPPAMEVILAGPV